MFEKISSLFRKPPEYSKVSMNFNTDQNSNTRYFFDETDGYPVEKRGAARVMNS